MGPMPPLARLHGFDTSYRQGLFLATSSEAFLSSGTALTVLR